MEARYACEPKVVWLMKSRAGDRCRASRGGDRDGDRCDEQQGENGGGDGCRRSRKECCVRRMRRGAEMEMDDVSQSLTDG